MATVLPAPDLYRQCNATAKSKGLSEEEIPSFSWFKFQFCPKDMHAQTAFNYTGRLKIRYMVQKRSISKAHDDDHYCEAIYRHLREFSMRFRDNCAMVSTDDKNKIKVGEPNYPISAVTLGKRVLVAHGQSLQASDHDFSKISLVPTVVLIHEIPNSIDESFYHGIPYLYLKIHATEPSSAIRNAKEIADALIEKCEEKEIIPPMLTIYTDGGPQHRSNFLSVQIALIALQCYLDLVLLIVARTASGHSYRNPPEKVNCALNLGLNAIGCMRSSIHSDPAFEKSLTNCNGLNDVRNHLSKNPDVHTKLLKELCSNCLDLIKAVFSRLHLKENNIKVRDAIIDREAERFFAKTNLGENLKCTDQKDDLSDRPKLQQYLQHCCRLRNYFVSIKKCGEATCTICLPPRLPNEVFQSVNHLPDPTPDDANEGHYLKFSEVFGTDTEESHTPSLKVRQAQKSNIGHTAVKQHATNTNLTSTCT